MPDESCVRIFQDPDALAHGAAADFVRLALARVEAAGAFNVALSGGSTPRRLFALLAAEPHSSQVPWESVHLFWGDERTVPPDHPDSNFGAARELLLASVPLPAANVHRIQGELDPEEAARGYESELRHRFQLGAGRLPRFDLALLGMGADGHTASLFPGSPALDERHRLVVAPWVAQLETYRVTLTCPVFNNSAFILFMVTGEDKAETLRAVLEGPDARYPAQLIRPLEGELLWYVDRAAGRLLEGGGAQRDL